MTAAILDIEPNIRRAMAGDIAAHFLRQAGSLIVIGSAEYAGTQALALEAIGGMVIQLAARVRAEFRRVGGTPAVIQLEDARPCDTEEPS